jgi:single-stranded DNA-specific DHH superfamily exonuclease
MLGMPRAARSEFAQAIEAREKILNLRRLYRRSDGTIRSVVVLKNGHSSWAGGIAIFIAGPFKEGYGMRAEVVERAGAEAFSLIVSVDTGIRASEVVRRAAELGIDVIVTDHHLPEAELAAGAGGPQSESAGLPLSGEKSVRRRGGFQAGAGPAANAGLAGGEAAPHSASFLKLVAIGRWRT